MKTISKTTLAAAVVAGAALLSSTSAFAFDGDGQGIREDRMSGDRQGEHAQIGDREGRGGEGRGDKEERPHLVPKEMMEQFREENKDLSDDERSELREERKSHWTEPLPSRI